MLLIVQAMAWEGITKLDAVGIDFACPDDILMSPVVSFLPKPSPFKDKPQKQRTSWFREALWWLHPEKGVWSAVASE